MRQNPPSRPPSITSRRGVDRLVVQRDGSSSNFINDYDVRTRSAGHFSGEQLTVARVSGKPLMWGILYTIDSELGVTASTGVNLSP